MVSQRNLEVLVLAWSLALGSGCKPEIGDDCETSTDCSNAGDRLCDTTQPGGYCTIFNCEPGTCPEDEAICVAFQSSLSKVCADTPQDQRLMRTFCLRKCSDDDDCRSGYRCIEMNEDNPWGAKVVEYGIVNRKVCVVPFSGSKLPDNPNPQVCTGSDAGFDALTPYKPDGAAPSDGATDAAVEADAADALPEGGDSAAEGGDGASDAGADGGDASLD